MRKVSLNPASTFSGEDQTAASTCWAARSAAEEPAELLHCDTGLADQSPERALGDLAMIRNGQTAVRRLGVAEDDVASALAIHFVAKSPEGSDSLSP
jgi:hypothetical protein